jgi:hypothetical protein
MEFEDLEKSRKRIFAYLFIAISLPLMTGFAIVDYFEGDKIEMLMDILSGLVFVAGFIGIKKFNSDMTVYRLALLLLSLDLLYSISIGAGNGTVVYWLFPFPVAFMFFLGNKEGIMFSGIFLVILSSLLINPFSLEIYSYDISISIRFIASLLFLTLIIYGLEASLEKYGRMLVEKNNTLLKEKQHLEKALKENNTLSGLIPICSNCKKIRDDEGYWHQVEVYVRDHSDANFTHGICPDCLKKLYPSYNRPTE